MFEALAKEVRRKNIRVLDNHHCVTLLTDNSGTKVIGADSVKSLAEAFILMDHCLTHFVYLNAISAYIRKDGRSRGSFIITDNGSKSGIVSYQSVWIPELCVYDRDIENQILEVGFRRGIISIDLAVVREIPVQDLWFEKVWKEYIEDNYIDC